MTRPVPEFWAYTGGREGHAAASCNRLRDLDPEAKQKALDESGLCMFCLRHAAGTEYYAEGRVPSRPARCLSVKESMQ
jgi:hypothetical protein